LPAFQSLSASIMDLPEDRSRHVLHEHDSEDLLDAISDSIDHQPPLDRSTVATLGRLRAVPRVNTVVNLARQYVPHGYDATALITRVGESSCRDHSTHMRAFKRHRALVEGLCAMHEPWRSHRPVTGAQAAIPCEMSVESSAGAIKLLDAYDPSRLAVGCRDGPRDAERREVEREADRG